MNKNILSFATTLLVGGSLLLTSCGKDETAPVITLTGDSVQTVVLNATLSDPGATANDEKDGDVTTNMTSDYLTVVNKDLAGTYTVTYTVSDEKANEATKTRTVIVRNDAYSYDGLYKYSEVINGINSNINDSVRIRISPSTTLNNEVVFSKFANYKNATVKASVSNSNTLSIASQTLTVGTDNTSRTFEGNGTRTSSVIVVNFSDKDNSVTPPATLTGCVGTYTKQ